jgi:hypothetical protein
MEAAASALTIIHEATPCAGASLGFYPKVRQATQDNDLLDEALVEHAERA